MTLHLAPGTAWTDILQRAATVAPEAFAADRLRNLFAGEWHDVGTPSAVRTPVDGTILTQLSRVDADTALRAVRASAAEHQRWAATPLDERKARVVAALDALTEHRDLLAMTL